MTPQFVTESSRGEPDQARVDGVDKWFDGVQTLVPGIQWFRTRPSPYVTVKESNCSPDTRFWDVWSVPVDTSDSRIQVLRFFPKEYEGVKVCR